MTWENEWHAYCKNCGQECRPEPYTRVKEYYDPPGARGLIADWRSPCCKDELSADPVSARCVMCGKCQDPNEPVLWRECDNCRDTFCPECLVKWRDLKVCAPCKDDLTMDKGPDWEEEIDRVGYLEDR